MTADQSNNHRLLLPIRILLAKGNLSYDLKSMRVIPGGISIVARNEPHITAFGIGLEPISFLYHQKANAGRGRTISFIDSKSFPPHPRR
jgi:hypothetical protein